jgi:hypothetical protein
MVASDTARECEEEWADEVAADSEAILWVDADGWCWVVFLREVVGASRLVVRFIDLGFLGPMAWLCFAAAERTCLRVCSSWEP